jgi:hypothetical protein
MPTPFMHLRNAHRFLSDSAIPQNLRDDFSRAGRLGAFLLGSVAPDARVSGGMSRGETHFFEYAAKIEPNACEAMLNSHPSLKSAQGDQRAFVAGYLGHIAMDVVWAEDMLFPYFYQRDDWADQITRYNMLHVMLCHLDARDFQQWGEAFSDELAAAQPENWLPFLSDGDLTQWRDIVAAQICHTCESQTLNVLGRRVNIGEGGLREILDDPAKMQSEVWDHVPQTAVQQVEDHMYQAMLDEIMRYTAE